MVRIRRYCCQILLLWMQAASTGFGQSPGPKGSTGDDSFLSTTICQNFNRNMTAPKPIVCPEGYRYCYTTGYVTKNGELQVLLQGCWLRPQSEEGACHKESCLFGVRPSLGSDAQRTCCCSGFVCNKNSTHVPRVIVKDKPPTTSQTTTSEFPAKRHKASKVSEISPKETVILGVISSVFATFLILSIVCVSWRCAARKNKLLLLSSKSHLVERPADDVIEYSVITTDGIAFSNLIHSGKFADIWTAELDGSKVAFKIYKEEYCENWKKEKRTYDVLGNHPNVAQFLSGVELLGPERIGKSIILTYYPCGSLFQFLSSNSLSWRAMYNLVFSLASGVAYIHGEIDEYDHFRRKVIVHRNLNSCSVLVKNDETCVLADFGTSVHVTGKQILSIAEGGNTLYMPPEVLTDCVNWNDWESSLKQADVYSVGLVFWEIVRRCRDLYPDLSAVPKAVLPYQLELGDHPPTPKMIAHVNKEKRRPLFPANMIEPDKSDALLRSTIEECWDAEPEARLTALCVVKRMQEVRNNKTNSDSIEVNLTSVLELSQGGTEPERSSPRDILLNDIGAFENNYPQTCKCSWSTEQSNEASTEMGLLHNSGCFHSDETC